MRVGEVFCFQQGGRAHVCDEFARLDGLPSGFCSVLGGGEARLPTPFLGLGCRGLGLAWSRSLVGRPAAQPQQGSAGEGDVYS